MDVGPKPEHRASFVVAFAEGTVAHSHLTSCTFTPEFAASKVKMDLPGLQKLAPPAVTLLVSFLAHSSQWLFANTEPGRLRKGDEYLFNFLVGSLLICYWRTCFTDPGRIPRDWHERVTLDDAQISQRQRWCRKCDAYKPPRAHHCKTCKRYAELQSTHLVVIGDVEC